MGVGLVGVVVLGGCASVSEAAPEDSPQPSAVASEQPAAPAPAAPPPDAPAPDAPPQAAAGQYIDYATYQQDPASYAANGDAVLFFNAGWCPTCRAAAANFETASFPVGLTVVSVDYDDNTALRQQYGVTVQHTFVQVDASGNELAKWTGSTNVDDVASQTV